MPRVGGFADTMSNHLAPCRGGETRRLALLCLPPACRGHVPGARRDFRGLERLPFAGMAQQSSRGPTTRNARPKSARSPASQTEWANTPA